ncbi:DUF2523 family protein [Variovorax sp. ZT4R33]|uniref:DUF2523 family protein n=1 Tax=Variovorax sp. ZT4R33 TaxID=3443743 RepID=UPI003F44D60E
MFGIVLSALNVVLAWVVRSLLVKFVLFFALYFITSELVSFVSALLPDGSAVNSALSGIAASTWYFLDVFMVPQGLAALVAAYATRFIIRRIPVIG